MISLIRKSSFWVVNQSSIPYLVRRMQKGDLASFSKPTDQGQQMAVHAHTVLTIVCKQCPALFRPHVAEFLKALAEEPDPIFTEVYLHALSAATQADKTLAPFDKCVLMKTCSEFYYLTFPPLGVQLKGLCNMLEEIV